MKAALRIVGALVCVAAAVILVLTAVDAHTWSTRLATDDLRYRRDASSASLWRPAQVAPGNLAQHLLGIGDDLAYRRALRNFRIGRVTEPISSPIVTSHRIAAQVDLTQVADTNGDARVRSQADNLLGVLGFGLGSQDYGQRQAFFNNAISALQNAVVTDPTNDDAFYNLEYALDQQQSTGEQPAQGSSQLGHRGGAGLKPPGHGY